MRRKKLRFDDGGLTSDSTSYASQTADDMEAMRADMAEKTADRVKANTPAKSSEPSSFAEAFRTNRRLKGAGATFTWKGKSYSTNYASDSKPAPKRDSGPAKPSAPATAPKAANPVSRNTSPARAPATPAPAPRAGPGANLGTPLSMQQKQKLAAAQSRGSALYEQGKANAARAQGMSERDKVSARMRALGIPGYKKGGSVDGCAIRGKTRAPLKGRKK
jgi:hypothetical protein